MNAAKCPARANTWNGIPRTAPSTLMHQIWPAESHGKGFPDAGDRTDLIGVRTRNESTDAKRRATDGVCRRRRFYWPGGIMPVSLLAPIAQDLAISKGQAGQAITVSGFLAVIPTRSAVLSGRSGSRRRSAGRTDPDGHRRRRHAGGVLVDTTGSHGAFLIAAVLLGLSAVLAGWRFGGARRIIG